MQPSESGLPPRSVAVVGLGQMGRGIAANLDRAGLLGGAWDVSEATVAAAQLSNAVQIAPPAEMAAFSFVLFVVPGSREIAAALLGEHGLLARPHAGQILVDLTTSNPADTRDLAQAAEAAGRAYVDCGMSGGALGADAGKLTLMVGGNLDAVARCRPVFDRIAAQVFPVGPTGAGHTMKLVHNLVCHAIFFATVEGCRLGERAGLDLAEVIRVFNAGNARSFISEVRFPKHILSGTFDGRSRVSNLAKDLHMAEDLASQLGQASPYGSLTTALLQQAMDEGLADHDFTTLYKHFEQLVGGIADNRSAPSSSAGSRARSS
jgi:3-hydroxyisobutyrate dehydrogenase